MRFARNVFFSLVKVMYTPNIALAYWQRTNLFKNSSKYKRHFKLVPMANAKNINTEPAKYLQRTSETNESDDHANPFARKNEESSFIYNTESIHCFPSTPEHEEKVIALLIEILSYREKNVSSWIVESKVKTLCSIYRNLLKEHRFGFLKVLAKEYATKHMEILKTAKSLVEIQEGCDARQVRKCEEKLKDLLTPQYSWLFLHMGRLETGVKFLVDLRTDVIALMSEADDEHLMLQLQQLNGTLRDLLSLWFSVGFLNLERVTWQSPCEMLQKISDYEAVHPVRSWTDLKRRVGLYRRCFVYTHSSMPHEPLVVLHTALSDNIASSMQGIMSAATRMSIDATASAGLPGIAEIEDPSLIRAAIFYSITSTQKGLQGIELGNYLIKRVVKELQAEFPLVSKFSTLSPIPTFRLWLLDRIKMAEKGAGDIFTSKEVEDLQTYLKTDSIRETLLKLFKTGRWMNDHTLLEMMERPLLRLCARYLYSEKRRGFALDSVANFHLKNGAVMWRLNWRADLTPRGLENSFGMMVNYRYFITDTEKNSRTYLEEQIIPASDQIIKLSLEACEVMGIPSKM